jgi:hypothetical protein
MAESVVRVLNCLFLNDSAEYAGAFQREMVVKFASCVVDLAAHVAATPKYLSFVSSKAQALAPGLRGDRLTDMADRVARDMGALAAEGRFPDAATIKDAVTASREFRAWQEERIQKVASVCGVQLSARAVESLMGVEGVDDLRSAIEAIETESLSDQDSDTSDDPDAAVERTAVDAAFMLEFEAEYGRDPTVHEYVHVKNVMLDTFLTMGAVRSVYCAAYAAFEEIHREYLDETLTEPMFCKRYLPQALLDHALPERHREAILESQGYRKNMRDRLGALHRMLFGEDVTEAEADYMFEQSVRAQKLALRSDKLNDAVVAFAKQTTRLYELVAGIYKASLEREPEDAEVREVLQSFRVDEVAAAAELRRKLASSLEFREVLRSEIVRSRPDLSVPAVFRSLEAVLSLAGLDGMTAAEAVAKL